MPAKSELKGKQLYVILWTDQGGASKDEKYDVKESSPSDIRPFAEFNYQIDYTAALQSRLNLKVPIPKNKLLESEVRILSKTPQRQLMSPSPEIKKPKPILTPLVKNNILKNNGIEISTFAKSPASKIRTL
jgi:hypothetical protein